MPTKKTLRSNLSSSQLKAKGEARSWHLGLAVLFVIGAAWRLSYVTRLSKSALTGSMIDDARIYWVWSERIATGHLVGSNPFFLAPLYPYVLGMLRALLGNSSTLVLIIQALWGAAAVALIADAVKRLTRPSVGIAIGTIMCFYEMAVFFDGLFLTESLLFFLGSLLLWWIVRFDLKARNWRTTGMTGVLIGLLAAGRATMALLLLPAAMLLPPPASRLPRWAALLGGFALVAGPITLHNYTVAQEWIPFTYNLGYNLYAGNNPKANGMFVPITGEHDRQPQGVDGGAEVDGRDDVQRREGLSLGPRASSSYWSHKATEYLEQHPGHAIQLVALKFAMMWNAREYPQIENVEEYRALAGPVGLPVIGSFALLGVLALVGAVFAWKAGPAEKFALGYAVVVSLSTTPFFVTDRYRHQLIPACALLAGLGLERLWPAWSGARNRWSSLGALVAGLVFVHLPTPGPTSEQRATLLAKNMGARLQQSAFAAARSGHLDQAERDFAQAVQTDPGLYDAWGGLILAQVQLGRIGEARETFARARAAGLPGPATNAYEALFAAISHDAVAAERALRQIPQGSLDADPILAEVIAATRRIMSGAR